MIDLHQLYPGKTRDKVAVLAFHPEVNDAASTAASEAVPVVLLQVDGEAADLVLMERAQAAAVGGEGDITADEVKG